MKGDSIDSDKIVKLVERAMEHRRQAIVYECARLWHKWMQSHEPSPRREAGTARDLPWTHIESLSQLRAKVGGRFQNLKEKWVASGFPLREHRGDRSGQKSVDYDGWVALALWIQRQGFEVRLAADADPWLFELRELPDREGLASAGTGNDDEE